MKIKDRTALYNAIGSKIGDRPCPLCGKTAGFIVDMPEHQIMGFDRGARGLIIDEKGGHDYIPCVAAVCKNCGCVQMLALSVLLDDPDYIKSSLY